MICSTCEKEVDEYYRGRQCKLCFRKPQKAWRQRNREKENAIKRRLYKENPEKFIKAVIASKNKKKFLYIIHHKVRDKRDSQNLTDAYIKKRIRQSWGVFHVITKQEIKDRREQIIKWRQKKQENTLLCPLVKKEIPVKTCHNMQLHYEVCWEECEYCKNGEADDCDRLRKVSINKV